MSRIIVGKDKTIVGASPSVILTNPKYTHNIGAALRACSCFGVKQLWYTGDRIKLDEKERLPREERMKGYKDVDLIQFDYPFDCFLPTITPVAVEVRENAEILTTFEHPENAIYVFGPEDGSVHQTFLRHCHRFVTIPTNHCTNLAAAVYIILYDRRMKRQLAGLEEIKSAHEVLTEPRGYDM